MPGVSNNPFIPRIVAPRQAQPFDLSDLPEMAKSATFRQCVDARALNTLLADKAWNISLGRDFDRACRGLVSHYETAPLGSWPPLGDWERLAQSSAMRDRYPHATLVSNLWNATSRMSAGLVTAHHAVYDAPIQDVQLWPGDGRLLRADGDATEFIATTHRLPKHGNTRVSAEGRIHPDPALAGLYFARSQTSGMCEASDSKSLATKHWIVRDFANHTCQLYNPTDQATIELPMVLGLCDYAATSRNARYVAAASHENALLFLHDRETGQTKKLECLLRHGEQLTLPGNPWQVSVGSDGTVYLATSDKGVRIPCAEPARHIDLERAHGNYRLGPDERYLIVNDATGTNLRLQDVQDLQGGASTTLLHPAADSGRNVKNLALVESPGRAWIATVSSDGLLLLYNLVGAEHDAKLHPELEVPLRMQGGSSWIQNATAWFSPDASEVHVGYTERTNNANAPRTVQLMRLPLV